MVNPFTAQQDIASNVRALRQQRGWRLEDLSDRLGEAGYPMSVKVLSKTENALRTITATDLVAFARVLDVDLDDLVRPGAIASDLVEALHQWSQADKRRRNAAAESAMAEAQHQRAATAADEREHAVRSVVAELTIGSAERERLVGQVTAWWGVDFGERFARLLED
jgi:transcriptional regulator with XRE-family HTH domain